MSIKRVWVEKHRPRSVDQVIMPDKRTKSKFKEFVDTGEIPNLLLYGGPGTGKTSLSLALIRDLGVHKMDVMKINCSDEKIDALRDKVKGFATTMPFGKFKVVRLEEFDYLGHDAQALLRALIEEVSGSCRFIATCNYINKVTPPLRSRFQEMAIKAPAREDIIVLAAEILEAEGVEFEIDDLDKVVAASYPDVRKMIQMLDGGSIGGKLNLTKTDGVSDWKIDLLTFLEAGDLKAARKAVCDSATVEELQDVFRFLFDNLHRMPSLKANIEDVAVAINDYQYKHAFVSDKEINIFALFATLNSLAR